MSILSTQAELELKFDAILAECPVWDDRNNLLYWVDILSGKLYRYNPQQRNNIEFEIDEHIGSLALCEDQGAVLALKSGFALFDFEKRKMKHLYDPEIDLSNNRFNDGKCDPSGRFWAGTLSYDQQQGVGSLYCLNTNLSVHKKLRNLTIPNGMAWSIDEQTFYFIDSHDHIIYAFDFDMMTGELQNRSVIFTLDHSEALPDGMTIDTEGKLWVALYNGFKVIRVDPTSGEVMHEILLPVPQVTSCDVWGT
ncbi:MAG: SMP-30/gluconolactonase/LRE family protein [Balneolaceae bacterium]|nr:SMP-30/gluconolactonase/LRE family protein [Balneolaceae bacterium]